ncbi:MAG: biopolymer transporter ExbD [Planctomycetota bacterium]|jgi:biopolymer transport protein ExbD|nr:biopolymer transporter ExbD [Planctomycetota bacterium]
MRRCKQEVDEKAEVSMSPLIDCVFLLLIFFLVATMMKKQDRDIDISLPESDSAEELLPDDDQIVIGISAEGEFYYQGAPVSLTQLHYELRQVAFEDTEQFVRLDADAEAPLHHVVQVLDMCQFDNLANVGIRTYDEQYNRRH